MVSEGAIVCVDIVTSKINSGLNNYTLSSTLSFFPSLSLSISLCHFSFVFEVVGFILVCCFLIFLIFRQGEGKGEEAEEDTEERRTRRRRRLNTI